MQSNGSILLDDRNIKYREQMTGRYQRVRQNTRQRIYLGSQGYTVINSSFISAASVVDNDLFIRFHNNSVYQYFGFANHFDNLMKANSKGQYFNRRIRPTHKYVKLSDMPFPKGTDPSPLEMTDEALFTTLDLDYIKKIAQRLNGAEIHAHDVMLNGIEYTQYRIDDLVLLRPKIKSQ